MVRSTPASFRMTAGGSAMDASESGAMRAMSRPHSSKALGPPYLARMSWKGSGPICASNRPSGRMTPQVS